MEHLHREWAIRHHENDVMLTQMEQNIQAELITLEMLGLKAKMACELRKFTRHL